MNKGRESAESLMQRGIELFLKGVEASAAGDHLPRRALDGASRRVVRTWSRELLAGYRDDPSAILKPLASRTQEDLVAIRDIAFSSVCMHHLLPFQGRAHIAYAPAGRITGLSRIGRLVDCLSRRLQLQEGLTRQIVDAIQEHLEPHGAACVLEASHTCVTTRGTRKSASRIVTVAFSGQYRQSPARRREVLSVLGMTGRAARTI